MSSRKLLKLAVMAVLLLSLLAFLTGLIQAAPALAAGSVTKMRAAGFAPELETISSARADLTAGSRPGLPPALPPQIPLLQGTPPLTVTKSASPDPVNAGAVLTYTIVVSNGDDVVATGVIITDTLDSNASFASASDGGTHGGGVVTWGVGVIPMGQTITRTLWVTVNQVSSGTILSNTAEVTSTGRPGATDTITTTVNTQADLALVKTDSPDPVIIAGDFLTYNLTVTNTGPSNATGVVLTDTLPTSVDFISASPGCTEAVGTVTCNLGSIARDSSKSAFIVVRTMAAATITNHAEVAANEPDPNTTDNTAAEETIVQPADLSIAKTGSPDPVRVGYPLTYTLTVVNTGPNPATGVVLIDTLPTVVDFVSGSLGCAELAGTVICTHGTLYQNSPAVYKIVVKPTTAGVIANTAGVTAIQPDPDLADNTITITTRVDPVTDLEVSKSDAPDPVTAGENLAYTLTITNNGPSDATGVVVTDNLPSGVTFQSSTPGGSTCTHASGTVTCNLGNLANGASTQVVIVAEVDPSRTLALSNSASVTGGEFDPALANNSVTENTAVNTKTDLEITKADAPDPVIAGNNLTYTLTVTNNGPSDATGIVVSDILPAGVTFQSATPSTPTCTHASGTVTCNLGNLANGASTQVVIVTKVAPSRTLALSNSASVTGVETDPNGGNNSKTANTAVTTEADLTVTKNGSPISVHPGDDLTYTITVTNNGPSNAAGVTLADNLPSGVTFQSSTPGAPTCTHAAGTVTCSLGNLSSNGAATVEILATVDSGVEGSLANTANVSSSTFDPNSNNDSDTENTLIGGLFKTFLPIVFKPAPAELSVFNDKTGGDVIFTVLGTGVSCTVPNNVTQFCGSFPPGTYTVEVVSTCGSGTFPKTYNSGPQTTRVFCN